MNDPESAMSEQLRRDAERISEAPFDRKLHQSTIRRIRHLEDKPLDSGVWSLRKSALMSMVALGCGMIVLVLWWPIQTGDIVQSPAVLPSSTLAYQAAYAEGEEDLLAQLDRDARKLLPRSSFVFQSNF